MPLEYFPNVRFRGKFLAAKPFVISVLDVVTLSQACYGTRSKQNFFRRVLDEGYDRWFFLILYVTMRLRKSDDI